MDDHETQLKAPEQLMLQESTFQSKLNKTENSNIHTPKAIGQTSSEEDHAIWSKAPEQPLKGPWGEIVLLISVFWNQLWNSTFKPTRMNEIKTKRN